MTDWDLRQAAARGETTPLSWAGWLRLAMRSAGLIGLLVAFVPLHYLYRIFAYGSPFPMLFLRYAARVCGARVEVVGTHLKRDVFFVANHVSWVDILALAGASGTAFVAKAELAEAPVVGWLASLNRTVFVKRDKSAYIASVGLYEVHSVLSSTAAAQTAAAKYFGVPRELIAELG